MGMYTVKDLKQRYIDHLMSMDLSKMDMQELGQYGFLVRTVDDMEKPGYAGLMGMMHNFGQRDNKKEE